MTDPTNPNARAAMQALHEHQGDPPEIARLRTDLWELRVRVDDLAAQVSHLTRLDDTDA